MLALGVALAWVLFAWAPGAQARTFRCTGANGAAVYTDSTDGYSGCHAVTVRALPPTTGLSGHARAGHGPVVLKGAVYRIDHPDGSVEFTNVRPRRRAGHSFKRLFTYIDTCLACALHSPIDWKTVPLHLTAYQPAVHAAARMSGVSPAFLRAVIHAESGFDPRAVSDKGAQGLMQLMPATASSLGVADAFDATQNIRGGARYLAQLLADFHGDRKLAAAAYNAGPKAVRQYHGVPPYPETRVYVKRVQTLYQRYRKALAAHATTRHRAAAG